jgi:hypothetical protein
MSFTSRRGHGGRLSATPMCRPSVVVPGPRAREGPIVEKPGEMHRRRDPHRALSRSTSSSSQVRVGASVDVVVSVPVSPTSGTRSRHCSGGRLCCQSALARSGGDRSPHARSIADPSVLWVGGTGRDARPLTAALCIYRAPSVATASTPITCANTAWKRFRTSRRCRRGPPPRWAPGQQAPGPRPHAPGYRKPPPQSW